jgi:hypothetical protein
MILSLTNLYKLIQIIRERGNWKLIHRSRKQLRDFILCREGMNRKSILLVPCYWLEMLKGLDVLVWRLETFGFIFSSHLSDADRQGINRYR